MSDLTTDARDGGYYIGATVKPREFSLDCCFEDITPEQLEGIYRWLGRGNRGRLVFDHKPFAYYDVVPSKKVHIMLYSHSAADGGTAYSGTFTAEFTAYEPFAKMLRTSYEGTCEGAELACTGILSTGMMPLAPTTTGTSFLMYNPGTERAHTIIRLAGDVGDG